MKNKTKIKDFIPDNINANRGSAFGKELLEKSFKELGAGRSVLLDKNNRIIAGNKSTNAAISVGIEDAIVVETTGDEIIAVKRIDIDLDSKKGRELALADNSTFEQNMEWDTTALQHIQEKWLIVGKDWDVEIKSWGKEESFEPNTNPEQQNSPKTEKDIKNASDKIDKQIEDKKEQLGLKEVKCPNCGNKFKIKDYD